MGFGMAGRVFHAPVISSVEGLELAAVVERHSDNAAQRYPGITTYRSVESMLGDASLGLFVVATPNGSHFEVARQLLEAGKNVIVDKPMSTTSTDIAQLMQLAAARSVLLAPFHNRRWDGDSLTVKKLLHDGSLGRLVYFESTYDRWRPGSTRRPWKDDPALGGGILLDLGTHVVDLTLSLFGNPEAITADVTRERDGEGCDDAFTLRLRYPTLTANLSANCLSALARPRFHLRGTQGNYWKWREDPQEAALNLVTRIDDPDWGQEPASGWGTLLIDADGSPIPAPLAHIPGDYRLYYAAIRDALLGIAPPPVTALDAWRTARLLEWAWESSDNRREILCDWSEEPAV
jgi:predicted dehydrogenase